MFCWRYLLIVTFILFGSLAREFKRLLSWIFCCIFISWKFELFSCISWLHFAGSSCNFHLTLQFFSLLGTGARIVLATLSTNLFLCKQHFFIDFIFLRYKVVALETIRLFYFMLQAMLKRLETGNCFHQMLDNFTKVQKSFLLQRCYKVLEGKHH